METFTPLHTDRTPYTSRVLDGPSGGVARVEGAFPDWLRGRLVRTAPALFERSGWAARHWFDALGQLYAFAIEGPARVSWAQRLLDSDVARAALRGQAPYAAFGTPIKRSRLRQLCEPVPVATDNANVNIVPMGDDWVAMTETDRQLTIDPATLATRGHVAYDDDLPRGLWMTAHPQLDLAGGLVVNVGTAAGPRPELVVYTHAPGARQRRVVGRYRAARLPYVHSFGLTNAQAVLIAHPFDVNPLSLLWSNRFLEHYRWRPDQGTRFVTIDRATGESAKFEAEPMFVFHTVNTFHDGADLVLDVLAYPDADVVTTAMRVEGLRASFPDLRPALTRVRLTPGSRRARVERLAGEGFEFPAINYRRRSGRRHGVVWGASNEPLAGGIRSRVVRVDVERGDVAAYDGGEFVFGEPIFVGRPGVTAEDDGVLLTVGTDAAGGRAKLLALDARTLTPVAAATIDVPLPLGFHGSFQRAARASDGA